MFGRPRAAWLSLALILAACHPSGASSAFSPEVGPSSSTAARHTPPVALVTLDGSTLRLIELEARAVIEGPLALTELHLTFDTALATTIDGDLELVLPDGATVSRLAMLIDGIWYDAEVVDSRDFAAALHITHQAPAGWRSVLIHGPRGNRLVARLFPLDGEQVEVIVAYSHPLVSSPYRLLLAGLDELERYSFDAIERGVDRRGRPWDQRHHDAHRSFTPRADVILPHSRDAPDALIARSLDSSVAIARVTIPGSPEVDPITPDERVDILLDTSASLGVELEAALATLDGLVAELAASGDPQVRVSAFDQDVETVFEGRASAFDAAPIARLKARGSEGATDLVGALRHLATHDPGRRVVVMSDGVATLGARSPYRFREAIIAVERAGVRRIDLVGIGRSPATASLRELAVAGLVIDAALGPATIAARLRQRPIGPATVAIPDGVWTWPTQITARPGDELLIVTELESSGPVEIYVDEQVVALTTMPGTAALVGRAHAGARIAALEHDLDSAGDPTDSRRIDPIVSLSTRTRVLSRFTSMLMLGNRPALELPRVAPGSLGDIVSVGEDGVEIVERWAEILGPDPDHDGLADAFDQCPEDAEIYNGYKDDDGCPDEIPHGPYLGDSLLPIVTFSNKSARLDERVRKELDEIAALLSMHPSLVVRIAAHTDRSGSRENNLAITDRAARDSRDYLISRGVSPRRLQTHGYGPDEPIASNDTKAGRALNRRLEFRILTRLRYKGEGQAPHSDGYGEVLAAIEAGDTAAAVELARQQRNHAPVSTIALGQALAADGQPAAAARVFGSMLERRPDDPDQLCVVAGWWSSIGAEAAAIDALERAIEARPDHLIAHHQLALARMAVGEHEAAFELLRDWYVAYRGIGRELVRIELGLAAAAWIAAAPERRADVEARVAELDPDRVLSLPREPFTLVVLTWNTERSDADLRVDGVDADALGYEDVDHGYGPEARLIAGRELDRPATIVVHYADSADMGPMLGLVHVIRHHPDGGVHIERRPVLIEAADGAIEVGSP